MRVEQERSQIPPDGPVRIDGVGPLAPKQVNKTPLMRAVEVRFGTLLEVLFRDHYLIQGESLQEIAKVIRRPLPTVCDWAHKLGIPIRSPPEGTRVLWAHPEQRRVGRRKALQVRNALGVQTDEDFKTNLTGLYEQEGSQKNMAEKIRSKWGIGVSGTTVGTWMHDLGIEVKKEGARRWQDKQKVRSAVKEAFRNGVVLGLSLREKKVLELRYLAEEKVTTLEKCGQELGCTRERIRQLERKALVKLQIGI